MCLFGCVVVEATMQHRHGRRFDLDQVWMVLCLASSASAAIRRLGFPRSHDLKVASLRTALGLANPFGSDPARDRYLAQVSGHDQTKLGMVGERLASRKPDWASAGPLGPRISRAGWRAEHKNRHLGTTNVCLEWSARVLMQRSDRTTKTPPVG